METDSADRRARVQQVLDRRGLPATLSAESASESWLHERFVARARALFYARLMLLTLGLLVLAVPVWRQYFGLTPFAYGWYLFMLLYSVTNYVMLGHAKLGRLVTYVTLCFDLLSMVVLVALPQAGGGLQSPLLATQLVFTTLFALLYPKPLAIVPPLLSLPITTRLDQLLDRRATAIEVLTLLWYLSLNFILIYVLVYLNEREVAAHREVVGLQGDLKELAVVEERNRLAREIHDGLGASLSSLIIQAEYLQSLATEGPVRDEVTELKGTAEEAIEELRRSLHMMREDFDLSTGVEEYVKTFKERTQLPVAFEASGQLVGKLTPEAQLALFRVLQETLNNAAKHAKAQNVRVRLEFTTERALLSVRDDGRGFDTRAAKPGHYGLLNMQERAGTVGGEVSIESKPGEGAHIVFSVPVIV
jgi:two-component system, NarL family, sensor histidine kinase DegS